MSAFLLLVIAGVCLYEDPYWLWDRPHTWTQEGQGSTPVLNDDMRMAKSLQLATRGAGFEVLLVGSSRVYRGLDPSHLASVSAYNLGISGMAVSESASQIESALQIERYLARHDLKTIVLGLDFFGFDRSSSSSPRPAATDSVTALFDASVSTVLGSRAVLASHAALGGWRDPDGTWGASGFKTSCWRSYDRYAKKPDEFRREHYDGYELSEAALAALRDTVLLCRRRDIELLLYISPIHQGLRDAIQQAGVTEQYANWVRSLTDLASQNNLTLWDFSQNNPYAESDLSLGSSRYYIDYSHFSPVLGDLILSRLGFGLVDEPRESSAPFGVLLVRASSGDSLSSAR